MINVNKLSVGDSFYFLIYDTLYGEDIDYPVSVQKYFIERFVDKKIGNVITTDCKYPCLYGDVYETEEEAQNRLKILQKQFWDNYKCDEILNKLLKLKGKINEDRRSN